MRYGENIKTVKRSTNIDNLYTAIRPISKNDNDKITTIASYPDWQQLDENGNVKFFHKQGENTIKAPLANARFGNRGINVTGGGYTVQDFSFDKISQTELFNRACKELETISVPAINYEVEGRTGAKIGDTVKIVDDGYTPELILSARVLEQEFSFDNASVEQTTFGNYKALKSQISADLIAKMQQLAEENAPYKAMTLTTNGLTFKNSSGSTILTARLYKGSKEIVPESYVWTIDGVAISGNSERHEITAKSINGKAVVRWSAIINGVTVAFDEVTITDVSDGISPTVTVNPDTSLTIVDAQGTRKTPMLKGTDGIAGKDGVGIKATAITYASHTNGINAPTTGYTTTVPSVPAGQFLWTKTVWTYTDNTSETGYSVAMMGLKGDKGDQGTQGLKGTNGTNGQDAITIVMTNDNVTLPANALGGVTSYANSGTTFSVFVGNVKCTPLTATPVSVENSFSVVSSSSGISVGSKTIDATGKVISYGDHANMSATSGATATITYTVTVRVNGANTTFTKVQNISKAEKGITGDDGIDSFTYFRYSPYSDGKDMTSLPNADSKYIGALSDGRVQVGVRGTASSYIGINSLAVSYTHLTLPTTERV